MKRMRFFLSLAAAALILLRPEISAAGAQRAMRLWAQNVAPSLLPFLALMPALTSAEACAVYDRLLSGLMRPLFRLSGAAAPALIAGMVAGSPGGAVAVQRVASNAGLEPVQARRLALALCGLSPAYLIMGVGAGLYGSAALGLRLACIQAAVQLAMLRLLEYFPLGEGRIAPTAETRGGMVHAVEMLLTICGHMVLFGAISSVAASFVGDAAGDALLLAADLPSGLARLAAWECEGKLLIQGAAIGFGGLCIAAQNMRVLADMGISWRTYLCVRGAAAAILAVASGLLTLNAAPGMPANVNIYAASLLAAGCLCVPGLFRATKNKYLNKTIEPKIGA